MADTPNSTELVRDPGLEKINKTLNEKSARIWVEGNKAIAFFNQGNFVEAEAAYNRAQAMATVGGSAPDSFLLKLLGDIYLAQGRYQDAIDVYAKVRLTKALSDSSSTLDLDTAMAYLKLGDMKHAAQFWSENNLLGDRAGSEREEFRVQLPGFKDAKAFEASIEFGRGLLEEGSSNKSIKSYQRAFDLFPQNGLFAYQLARTLMSLERYDETLPLWAKAATFGKGKTALDAKERMNNHYLPAVREKAMRDAAKL